MGNMWFLVGFKKPKTSKKDVCFIHCGSLGMGQPQVCLDSLVFSALQELERRQEENRLKRQEEEAKNSQKAARW